MNLLWRLCNRFFTIFGYQLKASAPEFSMDGLLARAASRQPPPGTIVDLGAAAGRWTRKCLRFFPDARYLLVEPLEERRTALERLRAEHPKVEFVLAAASDAPGEAVLSVASDLDGSGIYERPVNANSRTVPVISLDSELAKRALPAPYFLKFDTHGFEFPILAGATETLKQASMVLLEAYNFQLSPSCRRFHELCLHMESLGFRCADLADPMLRPQDGLLWQFDLCFLPKDSSRFASNNFA